MLENKSDIPIIEAKETDRGRLLCLCRLAAIPESAHPEIDRLFQKIGKPQPGMRAESRYLLMGDLKTAIYARRCHALAENNSLCFSVLIAGWPNLIRYIESRSDKISLNDFISYLSRKADPANPISDNSFAEYIFLLGCVCKLLDIQLNEPDKSELEKISRLVMEIPYNLDQGPFRSIDEKSMKAAVVSVGLNYPLCRNDAPRTKLVKQLLASEKSLPEEITGLGKLILSDVSDTMQCIYDSGVLSHVTETWNFEKDQSGNTLPPKEYFKEYSWLANQLIELGLVVKWSIRSQRQSIEYAIQQIENCVNMETDEHKNETRIVDQYDRLREQLAQTQAEIREYEKTIRKLEEKCSEYEKNMSELYAYREMFFDMALENQDKPLEEGNLKGLIEQNIVYLKEIRFAFIGGNVNLVHKLKRIFPEATFISERGFEPALLTTSEVIFIFADSVSHAIYYKVINNADRSKIRFLGGAVNIEKIIANMASAVLRGGERDL